MPSPELLYLEKKWASVKWECLIGKARWWWWLLGITEETELLRDGSIN